ncbi:1-aminocyclopropane-1-carboxylate synthase [Raphidocelis subcapitata]|uniref:1-aminocyclopropane-1-carboxylate synthase n=1 Tax=Raphidocelis subcapitata TaxID=307507 RepID=A0A2V0P3W8_9CHLO|nr:1-aminocyclopropane-1-carboxylate synthase [Raphidocelis subcapitata]|eukprot:GBF93602.1 1-aminocyclopropane-1-carboxylate synthase [Raphidocelis subcapitata]
MAQQPGLLAPRAAAALQPALSYGMAFTDLKELGLWSAEDPDGSIVLGVAENRISSDLVHERIASLGPFPPGLMTYQSWRGIPELGAALKSMLESTFMEGISVDPDHLTFAAGAGAIVDLLFHCIASPDDGVLIPAPYYPAFDNDLAVRNSVRPLPVHLSPAAPLAAQLDAAAADAAARGHPVRALLVSNPSNPLGTVLAEGEVRDMMAWCLRRRIHFVSDEIYALSVFGADGPAFVSAAVIAEREAAAMEGGERAAELVHVIFGASKDFCASGLRLGCLHSRNATLNSALVNLAYFTLPSSVVQCMFAQLFGDAAFMGRFVAENNRRLAASYEALTGALDALPEPVPYTPASAAMFLWIDLRAGLREATWEEEDSLWAHMVKSKRLLLTPGRACHAAAPGFFRICWAWMPTEALPVAAARMAEAVSEHRAAAAPDKAAAAAAAPAAERE